MRQLTESLISELNREDFIKALNEIPNFVLEQGWGNSIPGSDGVTLEEQIVKFNEISKFIKKHDKIIDGITYTQRNMIHNLLVANMIPTTIQITNGQQGPGSLQGWSSRIDSVYDTLFYWLSETNYGEDIGGHIVELESIKTQYMNAVKQLQQILKDRDIIDKFTNARDTIVVLDELKNQAQSKKDEIDKLGEIISQYELIYNDTTKKLDGAEIKKNLLLENLTALEESSKKQGEQISELLKDATSGVASKELQRKSDNIKLARWYWLICIFTILGVLTVIWAFGGFLDMNLFGRKISLSGIKIAETSNGEIISTTSLMILRIGLLLPFIILDLLFYKQLEFYKKLKEEYAFKANISGTLQSYVTILRTNEEWYGMKDYIMEITKDILKSPLPDESSSLSKQGKEIVSKVFDKTIDIIDKKAS